MSTIYVIDSSSLIEAAYQYNISKKAFAHIWRVFTELIDDEKLISSYEIKDELKDEDLIEWVKHNNALFCPLTKEIQEKAKEILAQFPNLIEIRSTANSNADPFLVATAIMKEGSIVTQEKPSGKGAKYCKIPNVCHELDIPCMNLQKFLNEVLE
jgi:predicted DNA-binding protein YlxM (UPF0122 family)